MLVVPLDSMTRRLNAERMADTENRSTNSTGARTAVYMGNLIEKTET